MLVKKTKKGMFSFSLDYTEREKLWSWIIGFLEYESATTGALKIKDQNSASRHLFYSVINDIFLKHNFLLKTPGVECKFLLNRTEAIALLLLLKDCGGSIALQEVKSGLHKLLS